MHAAARDAEEVTPVGLREAAVAFGDVGRDGKGRTVQLVDEKNRAWQAGKSFWRGITDLNSASLGIELVNPGHQFGYRAFAPAQIAALKNLLRDIIARNNLDAVDELHRGGELHAGTGI